MNGKKNIFIHVAEPILQRLEQAEFEAFLVGGCVREALRGEAAQSNPSAPGVASRAPVDQDPVHRGPVCPEPVDAAAAQAEIPTDIDVTTNALPEEICRVFAEMPVIETGIQHGTVTVLLPDRRRTPVEITTYRTDGPYSDGRHPDTVRFVSSLESDLARRDFTVNAMAMDLRGTLMDPFGGQADLDAGIIRAVGDPDTRFQEDALRILRALRFAAVLTREPDTREGSTPLQTGFRIEQATEDALFRCAPLLKKISAERIFAELKKLVCGPAAGDVIRRYVDILSTVLPELAPMKGFLQNNPYHNYDVLEHCIQAMEAVRPVPLPAFAEIGAPLAAAVQAAASHHDPAVHSAAADQAASASLPPAGDARQPVYMKLAALLHDVGKPEVYTEDGNGIGHFYGHPQNGAEIVRKILLRLKSDRFTADRITDLVRYHDLVFQEDDRLLKRWMNRYTPPLLLEILEIKRADNIATGNVSQELLDKFSRIDTRIRSLWQAAKTGETCFSIRDLAVSGRDLIAMGIPEGPEIGGILQQLLESVIDGELPNEREALLAAALRIHP